MHKMIQLRDPDRPTENISLYANIAMQFRMATNTMSMQMVL